MRESSSTRQNLPEPMKCVRPRELISAEVRGYYQPRTSQAHQALVQSLLQQKRLKVCTARLWRIGNGVTVQTACSAHSHKETQPGNALQTGTSQATEDSEGIFGIWE